MIHSLQSLLHVSDLVDLALVSLFFWAAIVWLRTTRARMAFVGLVVLAGVYAVAVQLQLQLTVWLLRAFFTVAALLMVIVFQEDLRRLFERIAVLSLRKRPIELVQNAGDILVRAVVELARRKSGALIVIPGRDPLDRHVEGGVQLHGRISEPLLLSLFDSSSPGHDGAVLLTGDFVERFALHLPLSHDRGQLQSRGTRHAAALGLAERCDALCVVVSEETGRVSVAREASLRSLKRPEDLAGVLRLVVAAADPGGGSKRVGAFLRQSAGHWREGLAAIGAAALVWLIVVPGAEQVHMSERLRVEVDNLPEGYVLESVDPPTVEITFEGNRRSLFLAQPDDLKVRLDALLVQLGRRTFSLTADRVEAPAGLSVVSIVPDKVRLSVEQASGTP